MDYMEVGLKVYSTEHTCSSNVPFYLLHFSTASEELLRVVGRVEQPGRGVRMAQGKRLPGDRQTVRVGWQFQ